MAFTKYATGSDDESAIAQTSAAFGKGSSGLVKKSRAKAKAAAEAEVERPPTWMGGERDAWPAEEYWPEEGHDIQPGGHLNIPEPSRAEPSRSESSRAEPKTRCFRRRVLNQARLGGAETRDAQTATHEFGGPKPIPTLIYSKLVQ